MAVTNSAPVAKARGGDSGAEPKHGRYGLHPRGTAPGPRLSQIEGKAPPSLGPFRRRLAESNQGLCRFSRRNCGDDELFNAAP